MSAAFIPGLFVANKPLVACYRHDSVMCRPGFWSVVFCIGNGWMREVQRQAVVDDFGDLVPVGVAQ